MYLCSSLSIDTSIYLLSSIISISLENPDNTPPIFYYQRSSQSDPAKISSRYFYTQTLPMASYPNQIKVNQSNQSKTPSFYSGPPGLTQSAFLTPLLL